MTTNRIRRVLVVDDEPDMAAWLATVVARAGYETRVATRGAEAEELFTAWLPDAALVDLVLPDVSGAELGPPDRNLAARAAAMARGLVYGIRTRNSSVSGRSRRWI